MKKSIVASVRPDGNFSNQHGEFYKYEIVFENGDSGVYNSKSSTHENDKFFFKVGHETTYEAFEEKGFPRIKPVKEDFKPNNDFQKSNYKPDADAINYHVALKEAREIIAMDGWNGHEEISDKVDYLSDIALSIAGRSKKNIEILKNQ